MYLIANNIRSAYNVGALFRICDAVGCKIIIQGISPHPPVENDERTPYIAKKAEKLIKKTALEAYETVDWKYFKNEDDVISFLNNNYTLYSLEESPNRAKNIFNLKKNEVKDNFALVVGHEKEGVSEVFLNNSKAVFYIPMKGAGKSLNVSVSAGVALYTIKNLVE